MLSEQSIYKNLLISHFQPKSEELRNWTNEPYEHNPKHPDGLIHKTFSGIYVRSKSEVLIDSVLYSNNIPFRYECALKLGNTTIFPDFTIRHPETGKFYYWEHFGMMDEPEYYKKVYSKLYLYNSYGIIPSIQLITTYETSENPLDIDDITDIVTRYFL